MNPQEQFCPNLLCSARGKIGENNIVIHSQKERRYRCQICKKTFSETLGTALYGIKKCSELFVIVVTLLAYGCPIQAIVMAFGLDERTVRSWLKRSGEHCGKVHQHTMNTHMLELGQVQADEIKAKTQGKSVWIALAMQVRTRLWLGGAVSYGRNKALLKSLADQIREWARCRPMLLAVDGLSTYVKVFQDAFRTPFKERKKRGRPRLIPWPDVAIVQVVKQRAADHFSITRRIAQGSADLVERLLKASQNGGMINTAYIERLNATFRQRLAPLARRSRALARTSQTLTWGMFLVGCVYNFCTDHKSLRVPIYLPHHRVHWVSRTPALAAGLTDHRWSVLELLAFKIAPPPFVPPKRRGRPPKLALVEASL
jgi:transposase-like protein/IS1 family transposase